MWFEHRLLTEGARTEGVILEWHAGARVSTSRLVVGFQPDGGERVEFSQSITDYVKAPAESLRDRFDPDVIPLSLVEGDSIPVRYRPDEPSRAVIDEPELHRRAIDEHRQGREDARRRAEEKLARGPSLAPSPAVEAPTDQSAQSAHDKIELLSELADLHARGGLTDDEFAAAKRKLLGD
jgi:hypothetical protein